MSLAYILGQKSENSVGQLLYSSLLLGVHFQQIIQSAMAS